jgi:2-oxoglutarate/2-oxoacid ferredoxin oxidoreductase subunit alpha
MQEVTIGIGGAAGDGLDKSGDTLAKTAGRLGLHVYAYNSYQSVIRGGHIWLRVRIGQDKVYSHGDNLTALIGLNQDTIERHTPEVDAGGVIVFNSDRLKCDASRAKPGVNVMPLPMKEITADVSKEHGPIQPIMQNTVALGAVLYMLNLGLEETANVLSETFSHKGQAVIDLNIGLLRAGYEYAKQNAKPVANTDKWKFTNVRRPFITGNEAIAIAAVAAGCKFYSAYPMTPASTILHWMANHASKVGVCVKQAEDELAVINMAIGAGIAGVRSMCGTAGGGFALMTEAIGMAGMMEVPVVCVEVQRGGPSTGLPTKTEQADLWQVFGASQGEFPRMIVAPMDIVDAYWSTVEAFNCAEKYQLPVLIMSDLLLSEHPETIDADSIRADVPIERGEIVTSWDPEKQGRYKRYKFTPNGVSPRALPGTANTLYVNPSDDHDEESILISDVFTSSPMRRKAHEKRMRKLDYLLKELPAPKLEGPADADLTLVGWGSSQGVIREAMMILNAQGVKTNMLQVKYIYPFHAKEVTEILSKAKKKFSVEGNYTSMFSKYLRAETGIAMDAHVNRYDGEPFEPMYIVNEVKALLAGTKKDLDVTEEEAKEMASHYLRTHLGDRFRPAKTVLESANGQGEPIWTIEIVERISGKKEGEVKIGATTGSTYSYTTSTAPQPVS